MEIPDLIAKAKVLLEALPFIQDFHGSIFVVKYGGSFMDDPDPAARTRVATDIAFLAAVGINVVVVHGGGKAISRAMDASGLKANFINGLRVTDAATIATRMSATSWPPSRPARRGCRATASSSATSSPSTTTATPATWAMWAT
jgi:hypothetical protein